MISIKRSVFWTGLLTTTFISTSAVAQIYVAPGSAATSGDLVHIDVGTCVMTTIGPIGYSITGLDIDSEGNLYGSESTAFNSPEGTGELIRIDKNTGAGFSVGLIEGNGNTNPSIPDITFVGQTLYGWTESGDDLITIDQFTGAELTKVTSAQSSLGSGMDADSAGTIYGAFATEALFTLDPVTGVTTQVTTMAGLNAIGRVNSLAFDDQDRLWANVKEGGADVEGNLVLINQLDGTFATVCTGLPLATDSIVYYSTPSDLIFKDGFGLIPFIAR